MSQRLVVFYNQTNGPVTFENVQTKWKKNLDTGEMFRTDTYFDVPDNSDSSEYFKDHHMEIKDGDGQAIFSFWDNDDDNYKLFYCNGIDWNKAQEIPGYKDGGNNATIGVIVSGSPRNYTIKAVHVQNDV